jgi:hypothetical protein
MFFKIKKIMIKKNFIKRDDCDTDNGGRGGPVAALCL